MTGANEVAEKVNKLMKEKDPLLELVHSTRYVGSMQKIMGDLDEMIHVGNLHEERYGDKWTGSSLNQLLGLVQEKATRLDFVPDTAAQLEELYDLGVYTLFAIHKAREKLKDFKYPDREEKTRRDHIG